MCLFYRYRRQASSHSDWFIKSEFQGGRLGRRFDTLLTAWADQLYLNLLGGGEGFEHLGQVEVAQGRRRGAGELVVSVDFAVIVMMFVGRRTFAVGGVG